MARRGFPPIYRMSRCKNCPRRCKPCLTVDEAEAILKDPERRAFNGDDLCGECHKKSNASQNKRTFDRAGRDWEDMETDMEMSNAEKLRIEIQKLERLIQQLGESSEQD